MKGIIFITGGSGLLGLSWSLAKRDSCRVNLGLHERCISPIGVKTWQINLKSVDDIARVFDSVRPEIVIHTAGLTNVEKCEDEPELAHLVNAIYPENVAKCCSKLDIPLVHISTDHLFSGEELFVTENQLVAPLNVYGQTKAEAEKRVLEAFSKALVIRANFYGWGPSYRHSFSDVIIHALRSGRELNLFKDVFFTPILIETLVSVVHELINHKAHGIYNVVGDERISKYSYGMKIAQQFSLDDTLIKQGLLKDQSSLVKRPFEMSLSNQKTCSLLGRKLGDVDKDLKKLHQQEINGSCQEIISI
ncbi:MAG: SDR family oxidoreductase [Desulfotalea sp.]